MSKQRKEEYEFFGILTKDLFYGITERARHLKICLSETELIIWNPTIIIRSF
jgi:hypothetical protein